MHIYINSQGEGGNHDYLYYLQDHIHNKKGEPWPWGGDYLQDPPNSHIHRGRGEPWPWGGGGGGLDCSVLCDGCACEEIEQSINETCMHKSKYYVYKCLSYID